MNENADGEDRRTPQEIRGPAVIGSGQYLCWTPCHHAPIRLDAADFEPWLPVVVMCPRGSELWTVEFPPQPPGEEAVAIWRRVSRARETDQ